MTGEWAAGRRSARRLQPLLRVELDDELLLDLGVNLCPGRKLVDEDAHRLRRDLEPRGDATLAGLGARDDERGHLKRLPRDFDDVVLGHPEGRDVDSPAVDQDMAMADKLAGHVAALGEAGTVHHVVQAALQDLEQRLTRTAGLAGGLFVVTHELLLKHAVDATGLLLLAG